ncbi:hypothetical protein ABMX48_36420 [Streptomyces cavourensis]
MLLTLWITTLAAGVTHRRWDGIGAARLTLTIGWALFLLLLSLLIYGAALSQPVRTIHVCMSDGVRTFLAEVLPARRAAPYIRRDSSRRNSAQPMVSVSRAAPMPSQRRWVTPAARVVIHSVRSIVRTLSFTAGAAQASRAAGRVG